MNKELRFKLESIKESLLNTANWDKAQSFNPQLSFQKIEEYMAKAEIKQYITELIDKEINMAIPDLEENEIRQQREIQDKKIREFEKQFKCELMGNGLLYQRIVKWLIGNL